MTAPVLKKATDSAAGDATKYGAPDVKKAFDIMDGTEAGGERIQASAVETSGASDVQTDLDLKAPLVSPSFTTPALGTPSAGVLTSCTGLPLNTGVTGILPSANMDADTAHLSTTQTFTGDKTFSGELITTGRLKMDQGADVTGGSELTLGADGNSFDVTGANTINTIAATDWALGNIVYLRFDGINTITHNSGGTNDILLGDAANMTTAAGDILTLQFDGTDWREVSRSVVGGGGTNSYIAGYSYKEIVNDNTKEYATFDDRLVFSTTEADHLWIVPEDGTIKKFMMKWSVKSFENDHSLQPVLRKNQVDTALVIPAVLDTPGYYEIETDVSVTEGDEVSVEFDNTGNTGNSSITGFGIVIQPS